MIESRSTITYNGHWREVFVVFLRLGLTSFGGPIAHLAYFRKTLVEDKRWVSEDQFSQLLAICQFLPGPASSQLGFTLGLLRAGWSGALAAFFGFTLPSALLLVGFAAVLPLLSGAVGQSAIHGLKLVACAVVADAVLGMSKKLCTDTARKTIAALTAATLLMSASAWSQILCVVAGAVAGQWCCRVSAVPDRAQLAVYYDKRHAAILFLVSMLLLLGLPLIADSRLAALAAVFYRAGALVFGGGHVVLPLLEDSVVTTGWIAQEQFLAGYGAAQAIPGPMFAFAAYLGALIPTESAGWLGAVVALICIFLPGFLLVAAALPIWRTLARQPRAASAIAGVNAAVVGLLAAALYDPIITSGINSNTDLAIAIIAFAALNVWRLSTLWVVAGCITVSVLVRQIAV